MPVYRCGVFIALTALSTVGCARVQTTHDAARVSPGVTASPSASFFTYPPRLTYATYLATDYDKPGHPPLTSSEVKLIRKTLAVVKRCQVRFLRYAFPSDQSSPKFVLFFNPSEAAYGNVHVLWQRDLYYFIDQNSAHAIPYDGQQTPDFSIQADIANTPCR